MREGEDEQAGVRVIFAQRTYISWRSYRSFMFHSREASLSSLKRNKCRLLYRIFFLTVCIRDVSVGCTSSKTVVYLLPHLNHILHPLRTVLMLVSEGDSAHTVQSVNLCLKTNSKVERLKKVLRSKFFGHKHRGDNSINISSVKTCLRFPPLIIKDVFTIFLTPIWWEIVNTFYTTIVLTLLLY